MNDSITFSLRGVCSYAWHKSDVANKPCFIKVFDTVKAFLSAICCGKLCIILSDVDSLYSDKNKNSIFGKEYFEKVKSKAISSRSISSAQGINNSVIEQEKVKVKVKVKEKEKVQEKVKEKVKEKEKVQEKEKVKEKVEVDKEGRRIIRMESEDFSVLMKTGDFVKEAHYMVRGDINEHFSLNAKGKIALPDILSVDGSIVIYYAEILNFPKKLGTYGTCDFMCCSGIGDLSSSDLTVSDYLSFNGCDLAGLPNTMNVGGSIDCSYCLSLLNITVDIAIEGNLILCHCTQLKTLPTTLEARRLYVEGCSSLNQLPKKLKIKTTLSISRKLAENLPDDAEIGSIIYIDE